MKMKFIMILKIFLTDITDNDIKNIKPYLPVLIYISGYCVCAAKK